jgi:hypothetical protein
MWWRFVLSVVLILLLLAFFVLWRLSPDDRMGRLVVALKVWGAMLPY